MPRKKTHEEFIEEVKALVGDEYTVVGTYVGRAKKVKIRHETCGVVNDVFPSSILRGQKCAKCKGVKKKTHIEFVKEVYDLVGCEYSFLEMYSSNKTEIEVRHNSCGIKYKVRPANFLQGNRCPHCQTTNRKSHNQFILEVLKLVGSEYKVLSKYRTGDSKIDIQHKRCGATYKVNAGNFVRGNRCPACKESKGEKVIRAFLKQNSLEFTSQKFIHYEKGSRPLRLDFYVQGIAIEYDGIQHFEPVEYFGGLQVFLETQHRDRIKDKYCADNGIPLIRIPYWEFDNINAILTEKLLPLLEKSNWAM